MTTQDLLYMFFIFALGSCVGSFLNVVIWRLPHRGREVIYLKTQGKLTLSWPPSHCPVCDSPIAWYQNVPILSWLVLRGTCANCSTPIPIRYPLVELGTAVLFVALYLAYFIGFWPTPGVAPGQQLFTDLANDWPVFVLHLCLVAALLAASAIDADWFIIPLSIPALLMVLGVVAAPFINHKAFPALAPDALHPARWLMAKPILGAAIGVILANFLLWLKVLPQSFANIPPGPEHPDAVNAELDADKSKEEPIAPPPKMTRKSPSFIAVLAILIFLAGAWIDSTPKWASLFTVIGGILIFLIGVLPRDKGQTDVTDEVMDEISGPRARHEILKEALFLAIPLACALIAFVLPFDLPQYPWLTRVVGSLLGLLAGGGIVWLVRIGGTLGFGREAMGLGDVHLMAGVGAIIGAPLVLIAFVTAPFLGILWAIVLKLLGKPNILPYGPWLSVASILCLLVGNPLLQWYLTVLFPPTTGLVLPM